MLWTLLIYFFTFSTVNNLQNGVYQKHFEDPKCLEASDTILFYPELKCLPMPVFENKFARYTYVKEDNKIHAVIMCEDNQCTSKCTSIDYSLDECLEGFNSTFHYGPLEKEKEDIFENIFFEEKVLCKEENLGMIGLIKSECKKITRRGLDYWSKTMCDDSDEVIAAFWMSMGCVGKEQFSQKLPMNCTSIMEGMNYKFFCNT